MAQNTSLPFSIGEAVVYPNQGLCSVIGIEEKEVANQKLLFIQLVRQANGAKVMVPTDKALSIGLRKIATRAEVLAVFEFLKSDSDKASLDWKTRARTNTEHMARGSLMGLAEVVKALQVLSELRPLPTKERELYNNARSMLIEEMAVSLGVEPCDAEDTMDVVLFPIGKARPRRTVEEFQLGLEASLDTDLFPLEEDALLGASEEDPEEDIEEEDNVDDDKEDTEAEIEAEIEEEIEEKEDVDNAEEDDDMALASSKTSPKTSPKTSVAKEKKTPEKKKGKTAPPKNKTGTTADKAAKADKAADKTNKAASRASSLKKKDL